MQHLSLQIVNKKQFTFRDLHWQATAPAHVRKRSKSLRICDAFAQDWAKPEEIRSVSRCGDKYTWEILPRNEPKGKKKEKRLG